ncbi:MAG TPA: hypothetical protein VGQ85_05435 [Candidatus Limnocylindrales bacterium]|nr:hypothetical protein [Candidatus Limnocylindrales bacterium]
MGPAGDLLHTIGEGISGLVGDSIAVIAAAIGTIVRALQGVLPGPLFPLVVGGVIVLVLVWFFRR